MDDELLKISQIVENASVDLLQKGYVKKIPFSCSLKHAIRDDPRTRK
jgi:hypothetical protein